MTNKNKDKKNIVDWTD